MQRANVARRRLSPESGVARNGRSVRRGVHRRKAFGGTGFHQRRKILTLGLTEFHENQFHGISFYF